MSSGAVDRLLSKAAEVVCELSQGQADALARDIAGCDAPMRIRQVAGLAAPKSVKELGDLWLEDAAVDPAGLANAIRCASRAVKTVSSYEKVELLYTGPDAADLRRNTQGLLEVVRSSRVSLWIVSFVLVEVDDVLRAMEERATAERPVEVKVLLDHKVEDRFLQATRRLGQLAPTCETFVWPDEQRAIEGLSMPSLHAKCAVADERQAFVSSANLTGKAMDRNLEVGYLVTGGETPRTLARHLDDLVFDGVLVPVIDD